MPRKEYSVQGSTYLCKIPDVSEQWALRGKLPLLPNYKPGDTVTIDPENPAAFLASLEFANTVLVRCGINPRFLAESPVVIPPGSIPVNEVPPEVRFELFSALMEDAGFTKKAAEAMAPITGIAARS